MTKRQYRIIAKHIRVLADLMRLRDWEFELKHKPPGDPTNMAHIHPIYGRRLANIYLRDDFVLDDDGDQINTLVHELVHCHLEPSFDMVRRDLVKHLGAEVDSAFWDGYRRQVEYAVDALAGVIAPSMPPIPWGKNGP